MKKPLGSLTVDWTESKPWTHPPPHPVGWPPLSPTPHPVWALAHTLPHAAHRSHSPWSSPVQRALSSVLRITPEVCSAGPQAGWVPQELSAYLQLQSGRISDTVSLLLTCVHSFQQSISPSIQHFEPSIESSRWGYRGNHVSLTGPRTASLPPR